MVFDPAKILETFSLDNNIVDVVNVGFVYDISINALTHMPVPCAKVNVQPFYALYS